ncbi:MAG: HD domain-containing protein [Deltaproteobacteria bacterium]|nr:HD domain-containing protein [Deltaproteobacteria bacterium]
MATTAAASTPGLRAALDAAFAELAEVAHTPGRGADACARIAAVYDQALAARFEEVAQAAPSPVALVATGGWARRDLAPHSDIDFVVLHDRDEAGAKQVCDRLLYPLWDEKLAIGHAVREPRSAARLARDDLATATALLDARHIAGDRRLTAELVRATLGALAPGGNPNDLIAALAAEKKARHDRFGASLYLLEPNLKQGIGALRDLATALWAAAVRWHPPRPGADPEGAPALIANLVTMGHLTRRQAQVLASARDFQLRIRTLVQLAARRRNDQLTFEIQEAIAPTLYPHAQNQDGDIRPAVAPAVEALMQDYYLHARAVVQVADRLLESARVPARRRPRIAEVDSVFITFNGELALRDPRRFTERPSEMVRLFRVAVAERLPVYGHTRELVAETIARDPAPLAHDPVAQRLLLEALVDLRDAGQPSALEVMHQLGILNTLLPEWAPCTARVQHDLYHTYTVDQHQLYALAMQKRLARGELAQEHPTATELWREVTHPAPLLLGTLLHDVGKPLGKGHAEKGAVLAGAVARRLGMADADVELTEFLVRQHLTMSHLSQRRDLSDPEVIARFAERTPSEQCLVQLYLLTLCDTAMTAPNNLSAWKDNLLRDLMLRARERFRGGATPPAPARDADLRAKVVQLAAPPGDAPTAAVGAIVDAIDPRLAHAAHAAPGGPPRAPRRRRPRAPGARRARGALLPAEGPQRARRRRARRTRRARRDRGRARRPSRGRPRRRPRPRRAPRRRARRRRVLRARHEGRRDPRGRRALGPPPRRPARAPRPRRARPRRGRHADRAQAPAVGDARARHARRPHRDPPARRLHAGDDRRGVHARPRRRPVRDHADARRPRPRHLAREGFDRGREGRRRVLRDARRPPPHRRRRAPHARRPPAGGRRRSGGGGCVSAVDLPPGIGLAGTPLGTFTAPLRSRRLAALALLVSLVGGAATWYLVSRHPWRVGSRTAIVFPVAFVAFALLGLAVRAATVAVTRDGVRWGWTAFGFHQPATKIAAAHVYRDGVALEARRGSWWFIAARDWVRFDALVRQLRRSDLRIVDHDRRAPVRARLQSYGRFLDGLLVFSILGSVGVTLWQL